MDKFTVYLVDDDAGVLKALSRLLRAKGYEVKSYVSPQEFLEQHDPAVSGCAVLDVSMPGLDGLELQQALAAGGSHRPIVFITGKGDVPTSVRAMKAGAIDFLTKPTKDTDLLEAVRRAEERDAEARRRLSELEVVQAKLKTLTPREREVLTHVVAGRLKADCRRTGHGRKDHQGPSQPDDGKTGPAHGGGSRPHGGEGPNPEIEVGPYWPNGQLDGRPIPPP
jgi:FixJ family two-component response regulator